MYLFFHLFVYFIFYLFYYYFEASIVRKKYRNARLYCRADVCLYASDSQVRLWFGYRDAPNLKKTCHVLRFYHCIWKYRYGLKKVFQFWNILVYSRTRHLFLLEWPWGQHCLNLLPLQILNSFSVQTINNNCFSAKQITNNWLLDLWS